VVRSRLRLLAGSSGALLAAGAAHVVAHAAGAAAHHAAVTMLLLLELGPLVRGKDGADAEEHLGVRLLEIGARLGELINLSENLVRVWGVGIEHWVEEKLLTLDVRLQVDELETALLENVVHLLLLVGGDADLLDEHGVLPPEAGRRDAEAAVHTAFTAHAGTHLAAAHVAAAVVVRIGCGVWAHAWARILGKGRRGGSGGEAGEKAKSEGLVIHG